MTMMTCTAAFVPTVATSTTHRRTNGGSAGILSSSTRNPWVTGLTTGRIVVDRTRLSSRRVRARRHLHVPVLNISDEDKDNVTTTQSSSPSPESDADEQTTTSSSSSTGSSDNGFEFQAPSLNTTVFSDFVDTMQNKVADLRERVQNVDSDKLVADSIDSSKGLVDNFLAGDWLNRGELYGAFQIALVLFLFKKPVSMDVIVALVTGPMMILAGAGISAKALWDLGVKNVSIWPAPVPDGTLKTEGLYEIVRHPIYSGLLLSSIGFAVATHSPARLAVCVGLAVLLAKKINVEEDFLLEAYGDYADYQDKVPYKILPKVY